MTELGHGINVVGNRSVGTLKNGKIRRTIQSENVLNLGNVVGKNLDAANWNIRLNAQHHRRRTIVLVVFGRPQRGRKILYK